METQITAEEVEGFNKIQKHLKNLPDTISGQISKAEHGLVGYDYTIRERFGAGEPIVYVPRNVKQIKPLGTQTIIYCEDYILRIPEGMVKLPIHYVFVEPHRNTDGHP